MIIALAIAFATIPSEPPIILSSGGGTPKPPVCKDASGKKIPCPKKPKR